MSTIDANKKRLEKEKARIKAESDRLYYSYPAKERNFLSPDTYPMVNEGDKKSHLMSEAYHEASKLNTQNEDVDGIDDAENDLDIQEQLQKEQDEAKFKALKFLLKNIKK
jgi:hypothetical protein